MWHFHWQKYGGRRMGKILLDSATSIEKWRGVVVLWGGVLFALLFLGTPLGDLAMSTWQILPGWVVPVFLLASLAFLFVRGLVKANYKEFRRIEHERDEAKREYEAIAQQSLAPVPEDLRQCCCNLADQLSEPIKQWQNGIDAALQPGLLAKAQRQANEDPDGSLEIRAHGIWLTTEYRERHSVEVLKLSDDLFRHRCITPDTRNRFENLPTKPEDVLAVAKRLELICRSSEEG